MQNIDNHPLRYSSLAQAIEQILLRRSYDKRLNGYTLAAAIEIAEQAVRELQTVDCALVHQQVEQFHKDHR